MVRRPKRPVSPWQRARSRWIKLAATVRIELSSHGWLADDEPRGIHQEVPRPRFRFTLPSGADHGSTSVTAMADARLQVTDALGRRVVPISKPIFSFPGGRRFHFIDPGGNELAAMQVDAQ